jgi:signal peptidase
MKPSEFLQYVVGGLVIGAILLLLVTQLLGQPAIVFVETGSMAPTLEPNDGYLAVPAMIADDPEVGDVILFQSQELGGGELTTHRVVDITEEGYITQGDANPFTDQDGDEPPVADGQVRAVALTIGDGIVTIPGLGASVGAVRSVGTAIQDLILIPLGFDIEVTTLSTAAMVAGLVLFVYGTVTGATNKRQRSRSRGGVFDNAIIVIAVLALVVIIPLNISMLLPSGVYQYEILSSESPTDNPQIIPVGGESEVTYAIQNSGQLPVLVFLEAASDGVEVRDSQIYVPRRSTVETSIAMQAPDQTGSYLRFIREYRYLVVLPPSLIASLHAIHPLVAIGAINLFVGGIVVGVAVATVGTDRLRLRSRNRELELGEELRRIMPSFLLRGSGSSPPSPPGGSSRRRNWFGSDEGPNTSGPKPPTPADASDESTPERAPPKSADDGPRRTLTDSELVGVHNALDEPPADAGLDGDAWSLPLLQRYLFEEYGVDYPREDCKRLLRRAGHLSAEESASEPPADADAGTDAPPDTAVDTDESVVDPGLQAAFESAFETKPLHDDNEGDDDEGDDDETDGDSLGDNQTPTADEEKPTDVDDSDVTAEPVDEDTLWDPVSDDSPAASTPDPTDEVVVDDADDDAADEVVGDDGDTTVDDWGEDGVDDSTAFDDFASLGGGDGLSDEQYMAVITALNDSPSAADYDAEVWTPATLQEYLADTYDVDYPREQCVELLRSAGHDVDE